MAGTLYLIPSTLVDNAVERSLPPQVHQCINSLTHYIVENEKTARAFLKSAGITTPQNQLTLYPYDKKTTRQELHEYIQVLKQGTDMGLLSEAGCPGVADPGAEIVAMAHGASIRVDPLVGPSSILLAIMASGMSGQCFTFHGYLPISGPDRVKRLKDLERNAERYRQTQVFIETPFRNNALLSDILKACLPDTLLHISVNLTGPEQQTTTLSVSEWRKRTIDLHKQPAVFCLYRRGSRG